MAVEVRTPDEAGRGSLATRIVLTCVAVAGIAVLVAGLVMAGLARRSAQTCCSSRWLRRPT